MAEQRSLSNRDDLIGLMNLSIHRAAHSRHLYKRTKVQLLHSPSVEPKPMPRVVITIRLSWFALLVPACFWLAESAAADDNRSQPIRVSPDGHFLAEPDGKPFFWLHDWAYELFKIPDRSEVERYFKDRSAKGFNVIMAPVTGFADALTRPNPHGNLPFIDNDPMRPNPDYFEHADWIIERAQHHGMRVALFPTWGGPVIGSPGPGVFNAANAEHYGRWLANRYQRMGILWVLGGDFNPLWPKAVGQVGQDNESGKNAPSVMIDYTPIFDAFAKGILEGSGGFAFITYHPTGGHWPGTPEARTSLYFADRQWLTMNMIQSGHHTFPQQWTEILGMESIWNASFNYEPINAEYHSKPTRPVIDGEPRLEDEGINLKSENGYWKAYDIRNAAYHALFAGAAGIAYGNVGTGMLSADTPFLKGLQLRHRRALSSPGSEQMQHAKALMLSRPYFARIPDQSIIVGDQERGEPYVSATRDREGSYAMLYLPHGLDVMVDTTKISGTRAVAWWFDPRTGQSTRIDDDFPTTGTRTFEPPSSGADTDWVLVLDDASRGFPPPGTSRVNR